VTVTIRDRGLSRLASGLGSLTRGARMTAGVHEDTGAAQHHRGATVADVAVGQEFHTQPYVRPLIDAERATIERELSEAGKGAIRDVIRHGSAAWERTLSPLGRRLVAAMRSRLSSVGPNEGTGKLAKAIEFRIVGGR
jgi:hypothetical protein